MLISRQMEKKMTDKPKICALEGCNRPARRNFCCNKHKDRFHNLNNPRGIYAHLNPKATDDYRMAEDDHPFSSEALGQE